MPSLLALGQEPEERGKAYIELFRDHVDEELPAIRAEINRSGILGGERFKDEIEAALARRVRPGVAGRPRKEA